MTDTTNPQDKKFPVHFVDGESYLHLGGVVTKTATAKEVSYGYIEQNIHRKIPRMHQVIGFMQLQASDAPIGLVGGGPSLKNKELIKELKEFSTVNPIIACGSSYDWCINNDIIPDFSTVVDADPITANYIAKPHENTVFLIASQCHPSLFDHLKDYKVAMWHCASQADAPFIDKLEPGFFGVGGGCTVGLRSINIALMFGYTNQHYWGFDSCLDENGADHAYALSTEQEKLGLIGENGKIHRVRIGDNLPTSKVYHCMGYQLAQMQHFKQHYEAFGHMFTPTFHGEGVLPDLMKIMRKAKEI